jgi:AraC family transcriptional regulator of adaptative response/methylated-DNA-[protein]-cysteine methyltransferase
MSDYDRIARAIQYLEQHVQQQPSLEEVAEHVNLSPYHFQRLFSRWAGISPKRFLQVMTVHHAKQMLDESFPLIEVSDQLGLSSSSRLHDHFVTLEAMTPGEYQRMGVGMEIVYGLAESPFGLIFVAFSQRGVCRLAFLDNEEPAPEIERLHTIWPESILKNDPEAAKRLADQIFHSPEGLDRPLSLLVSGTNFQIQVWRALLDIPMGKLASYTQVASSIGRPGSARAVGNAVGANPVAFLIPCHRVIHGSGKIEGYRWGGTRKRAMIAWESSRD